MISVIERVGGLGISHGQRVAFMQLIEDCYCTTLKVQMKILMTIIIGNACDLDATFEFSEKLIQNFVFCILEGLNMRLFTMKYFLFSSKIGPL